MFKKDMSGKILGDRDLQKIIGTLLRFGVITASVIALLGGIIYLFVHGSITKPAKTVIPVSYITYRFGYAGC